MTNVKDMLKNSNEIINKLNQPNCNYNEIKLTDDFKTNIDILIVIIDKKPNDNTLNWIIIKVLEMFNNKVDNNDLYKIINELLKYISKINTKDNIKYLTKLDPVINHIVINNIKNPKYIIEDELLSSAKKGNYHVFTYWVKYAKLLKIYNNDNKIKILCNSIHNFDDRILKHMLAELKVIDKSYYTKIFIELGDSKQKYIFDKMYILSKYIDFSLNFNEFLCETYQTYDNQIYDKFFKYYYKFPLSFKTFMYLFEYKTTTMQNINIYNRLSTDNEKMIYQFCDILYNNNYINVKYNYKKWEKFIIDNINNLLYHDNILERILSSKYNYKFTNLIIQILQNTQLINKVVSFIIYDKYLNNNYYKSMLLLTRFYVFDDYDSIHRSSITKIANINIKYNFILHKLRLWAKRYKRNKFITYKALMLNVLNELENYVPNNKPVLKNGSLKYQLSKQSFNVEPSRYLTNDDLPKLKNYIIREKVKGVMVNSVPFDIYPSCDLLNNHKIKAIYNEELELYIIIDIDIPNKSIVDRNELLWSFHNNIKTVKPINTLDDKILNYISQDVDKISFDNKILFDIKTINNLDEFNKYLKEDKDNLEIFLNENDSIKWYPIKLFNVIHNETIEKQLLDRNIDIIIKQLDDSIELKVTTNYTIYLLYDGINWIDNDNNNWNDLVITEYKEYKKNEIYKCYFYNNNIKIGEYRYDKIIPDSNKNINIIINKIFI